MVVIKIDHILNQHPIIPSLEETTISSFTYTTHIVSGKFQQMLVNFNGEGGNIKTKQKSSNYQFKKISTWFVWNANPALTLDTLIVLKHIQLKLKGIRLVLSKSNFNFRCARLVFNQIQIQLTAKGQ